MTDGGAREAMARAVRAAIAGADGHPRGVDAALAKLGWRAMLDEAPDDAVAIVFRELGAANAASSALNERRPLGTTFWTTWTIACRSGAVLACPTPETLIENSASQ